MVVVVTNLIKGTQANDPSTLLLSFYNGTINELVDAFLFKWQIILHWHQSITKASTMSYKFLSIFPLYFSFIFENKFFLGFTSLTITERNFFETSGSAYLDGFEAKLKTKPKVVHEFFLQINLRKFQNNKKISWLQSSPNKKRNHLFFF